MGQRGSVSRVSQHSGATRTRGLLHIPETLWASWRSPNTNQCSSSDGDGALPGLLSTVSRYKTTPHKFKDCRLFSKKEEKKDLCQV